MNRTPVIDVSLHHRREYQEHAGINGHTDQDEHHEQDSDDRGHDAIGSEVAGHGANVSPHPYPAIGEATSGAVASRRQRHQMKAAKAPKTHHSTA